MTRKLKGKVFQSKSGQIGVVVGVLRSPTAEFPTATGKDPILHLRGDDGRIWSAKLSRLEEVQ